jgi:uncharacterized membrane protein
MRRKTIIALIIFSVLGILNSSYLTYLHYSNDGSNICSAFGNFACDIVNKSTFSELTGIFQYFGLYFYLPIPLSVMGLCFFMVVLAIGLKETEKKTKEEKKRFTNILFFLSSAGLLFGLFLIYIQAAILRAWCLFCLINDVILLSIVIAAFIMKKSNFP